MTRRETFKAQLEKLDSMNRNEAAEKLGHEYFQGLIPRKPCLKSRERQWEEIRTNFRKGGLYDGVNGLYSLLHACAEYGHELLLSLLLELGTAATIDYYDGASNVPLARAVIGHENGTKVPASISRILLEHGAVAGYCVVSEGLYAFQKPRPSPRTFVGWAKNGSWPWPETKDLIIEKGWQQGYQS